MGFYTGRSGSIRYAGKKMAKVRDWSLESTVELLSTNTIESTSNTFTPGVKGATGTATLLYYRLEGTESNTYTQFTQLLEATNVLDTGSVTTANKVTLELEVGSGADDDITFDAYITSVSVGVSTGELSTVNISFTVDGDFTTVF